jgi:hypothetical protein
MKKKAETASSGREHAVADGRPTGTRARLLASEQRLIQALDTRRLGVFDRDVSSGVVVFGVTEGLERLVPREPGAPLPVLPAYLTASVTDWNKTTHPDDVPICQDAVDSVIGGRSDEFTIFVERGAEIVRRYRRLTSMRTTARERFDIVASARQIVGVIAPDAHRAGIGVALAASESTCEIEADRIQVEQVLLNLVRNGVDAAASMSVGPRNVTVAIRRRDHGVKVDISDSGPEIPETARASLFKPFFTTKPDGTGLGLSLSRTIVEAHGGRLTLECGDPGRTTFTMELP